MEVSFLKLLFQSRLSGAAAVGAAGKKKTSVGGVMQKGSSTFCAEDGGKC
jgi:hypothetical protein